MPEAAVPFDYSVRRSDRARRVRVRVDPRDGAVEVVLPRRAAQREAAAAVAQLGGWIARRRAEAAAARARVAARDGTVPYLGTDLRLVPEPGRTRVHRRGDVLLVGDGDPGAALERWYRRQARVEIAPRLDRAAGAVGRPYTRLTIRDQRTRWGSCSATGAMSFNWRLLLAPERVLEYVVRHEAAHLVVMDHSPRFWALMERLMPGHEEPRRWLRTHGATLVL
ncbi:M48 family metallopeptidase [Baekduia soli]|uniref:M48 family metallopeptidase n=1 Tax=Baekduia soli TaxID=496014 RepID=UPI001652A6B9|nr:SprT family zinc-dependent metalloprotease [Baekduia soli]